MEHHIYLVKQDGIVNKGKDLPFLSIPPSISRVQEFDDEMVNSANGSRKV